MAIAIHRILLTNKKYSITYATEQYEGTQMGENAEYPPTGSCKPYKNLQVLVQQRYNKHVLYKQSNILLKAACKIAHKNDKYTSRLLKIGSLHRNQSQIKYGME